MRRSPAWAGRRFGVTLDPDTEIVPTLGSKEAVFHLAAAARRRARGRAAAGVPGVRARRGVRGQGGARDPAAASREGFLPDLDAVPADVWARTAILWLNYPNNPTAATAPLGPLRARGGAGARVRLRARVRRGVLGDLLRRAAAVRPAGARQDERGGLQHALQAVVDAGLPVGVRGRRPRADRGAQALPPERRRRAAGVHPARGRGRLGRRGARRGGARALPGQARRAAAGAGGARSAQRGR